MIIFIIVDVVGVEGASGNSGGSRPAATEEDEKFDLGDLPERLSDIAGYGNIPELTLVLEDDEVIDKFEVRRTLVVSS